MKKVFITGASGCVGHYVVDQLIKNPDYQLYLLVRNPAKLMFDYKAFPNITLIRNDMRNIEEQEELLKEIDFVVHIAAGWGDTETNYDYTYQFFELLDPNKCQKVIYFSTASILASDGQPIEAIEKMDASYVRGKYLLRKNMKQLPIYNKIITLYPTWVLGGDAKHPYSHALQGIIAAKKWLWLLRFFTVDVSFHFIHAYDMAQMVSFLLENDTDRKEMILGNKLITATELINELCGIFKKKTYFKIRISPKLVKFLFGRRLSDWDRYCLGKRHFQYNTVNVQNPKYPTIESIF